MDEWTSQLEYAFQSDRWIQTVALCDLGSWTCGKEDRAYMLKNVCSQSSAEKSKSAWDAVTLWRNSFTQYLGLITL